MTPQERHEDVVRRYPGGLNPEQFRREALASADADGKLDPPALADTWAAMSLLIGMYMEGLIEKRGPGRACERTGPWFLTEAGRRTAGVPGIPPAAPPEIERLARAYGQACHEAKSKEAMDAALRDLLGALGVEGTRK